MFWPAHHRALHQPHEAGHPHRTLALLTLCLAMMLSALDMTIINVALPSMADDLGASSSELQWIVDSYTIVLAGFLLLGNGIADRFGRRRAFVEGMIIFGLSTLAATFASSAGELIVCRVCMGLGAALILGPALSLIAVIFPPEERGRALGLWTLLGGIGIAMGPVIGGVLLSQFWWGSIFLVTLPVCVLATLGGILFLPESRRPGDTHLDLVGAALSVLALAGTLYAIIEGPLKGWGSPDIVASLVLGVAFAVAFVRWELRSSSPMFDPKIFGRGPVVGGTFTLFVVYITFIGMMFIMPQWLQFVAGHGTLAVGLLLLPISLTLATIAPLGPKIQQRLGTRHTLLLATSLQLVGLIVMSFVRESDSYITLVIGGVIAGAGLGFGIAPATATVFNALPTSKAGDGSGANQLARQIGSAFSVALLGSALAIGYQASLDHHLDGLTASESAESLSGIGAALNVGKDVGGSSGASLVESAKHAFVDGSALAFALGAALSAIAVVVVWFCVKASADVPYVEDGDEVDGLEDSGAVLDAGV